MVNLWPGIPAECLCNKHLNAVLAEHNNKLMPSMRKGHSIEGYLKHGCIDIELITTRIADCLKEGKRRGHKWKYAFPTDPDLALHYLYTMNYLVVHGYMTRERRDEMTEMNKRVLSFRCPECRKRIKDYSLLQIEKG